MNDTVIKINNSLLQHGKYNDRIYLMKLSRNDNTNNIIHELERLAETKKYSKIIAKVPEFAKDIFLQYDYTIEASIPGFYKNSEDVYFMGKYFSELQKVCHETEKMNEILNTARLKAGAATKVEQPPGLRYKICNESDVAQMKGVYEPVFATYPFPIHDTDYL